MSDNQSHYPAILAEVMQVDQFRLRKAWGKLALRSASDRQVKDWYQRAEDSRTRRQVRSASIPELSFDEELPITNHREQIVELLKSHQTIVICGETGSGKSTQLPKLCLEAGLGRSGLIGHTQPRRLAARAIADRLADELKTRVGQLVGFKIRFSDTTSDQTLVKLMTDGILLAETQTDRFLDQYDALIIDEAHERSLNIDFLLGYLNRILIRRPQLRLIITSATIDPERFAKHFSNSQGAAPIVEVSGRTYPVDIRYRPQQEAEQRDLADPDADRQQATAIANAVDELWAEGSGDILTFLPTERDIRISAKYLRGHFASRGQDRQTEILPLYARLSHAEQNRIFAKHSKRRIVLATNVAESSLTVPGIRYVIDSGLVRISRYAPRTGVRQLPIESVSQASANQRAGRCGRLGPGVCIRLFGEDDFEVRPKFTTPEIRRSDLASVLLQSAMLRLGPLEDFPLMDMPSPESLRDARRTLRELGAIDGEGRLTRVGKQLGGLPCEPRVGRMLVEAVDRRCLSDVIIIAAALECQDVRQRPAGQRERADEAHAEFQDPYSDFLSYLRLWDFYQNLRQQLGRSRLEKALRQKFLSYQGFREWSDVVRQLKDLLTQAKLWGRDERIALPPVEKVEEPKPSKANRPRGKTNPARKPTRPAGYEAIHQSLLAGLLRGIGLKSERHEYEAAGGLKLSIWPGSGLFQRLPKWILVAEIVETNRRYGRTVAEIDAEWIEEAGSHFLKHSYSDPHWSSKVGAAMVYRRSTLFGLPVVSGYRAQLSPIDPTTARQLMIEHGLVEGQWKCREDFYQHNRELLADMAELTDRTRSREFIVDRFDLLNFYNKHLPDEIVDLASLRRWMKRHQKSEAAQRLWMQPKDLLGESQQFSNLEHDYPNSLNLGGSPLPLKYQYAPGSEQDGVTLTIPRAALRQVSSERLAWLVPGLLEEKILFLIKSLPKSLRTHFLPAPEVAKELAAAMYEVDQEQPFTSTLCELMSARSGERIRAADFVTEKLPQHLQFLVRVLDDDGTLVGESRSVQELQKELALPAQPTTETVDDEWQNVMVTPESFEGMPESVMVRRGGLRVAAYPTLVDLGDRVEIQLEETELDARMRASSGEVRLFSLKHRKLLRQQVAHLPNLQSASVRLGYLISGDQLREQLADLILRIALVEGRGRLLERADFDARNAEASQKISIATQDVAVWLPKFSEQVHTARLKMESAPSIWHAAIEDMQRQLEFLFPADWLRMIPWSALMEYPRYLKAIEARIDKLSKGGIPKDRRLSEPIEKFWGSYQAHLQGELEPATAEKLDHLRWMIEEYRVSVFAQQLGTRFSVSQKRLQQVLESINS